MFKNLRMFLNYSVILFFLSHFRNTNQTGGKQIQDFTVTLYHSKQSLFNRLQLFNVVSFS